MFYIIAALGGFGLGVLFTALWLYMAVRYWSRSFGDAFFFKK